MITKIGNYELGKAVSETSGLTEFTDEEYFDFARAGAPRTLSDEKIYIGNDVEFNGNKWLATIGANKGLIYNISIQIIDNDHLSNIFESTLKYLMSEMGRYNEHPIFSSKYLWFKEEGTVVLIKAKRMGHTAMNLILTSSAIRDEAINSSQN